MHINVGNESDVARPQQTVWLIHFLPLKGLHHLLYCTEAVAYLGFPAPWGKLSYGAPTQPVHGSIDAKNELGIKECRKLPRALQSPEYSKPQLIRIRLIPIFAKTG